MELVAFQVRGWKRFKEKTTLQTNSKLVAILGPNEAGKSSLLGALNFLRNGSVALPTDLTRSVDEEDLELTGYFSLSADDIEAAGLSGPSRLVLHKKAKGNRTFGIEPPAHDRDLSKRKALHAEVERALTHKKVATQLSEEDRGLLKSTVNVLAIREEDLTEEQRAEISDASKVFRKIDMKGLPKYIKDLPTKLDDQSEIEAEENPWDKANRVLKDRIPDFLFFGDADRNLQQEYSFDDLSNGVPTALSNLCDIAGLDIPELVRLVDEQRVAEVETVRSRANRNLRDRFAQTWSQAGVRTSLIIKDRTLQVLIENDGDEFTALAERSDGFRQFVALQSFVLKKRAKNPILLIDEAELHLHYDAQADLTQMLARQDVARKVIYTTHSAGCLPEDLGNGVRFVAKDKDPKFSKVVNRFWGGSEPGFSPLLIGMGASTLAFFPTRRALLVEGEVEMLLLPTLIREALGLEVLGFQVVPGLSKANKALLPKNGSEKNHVAYLVDTDPGGQALRRELKGTGIEDGAIFDLYPKENFEIEDLVSDDILLSAINNLIDHFSPGCGWTDLLELPKNARIDYIEAEYRRCTGKALSKVDLAYEILNLDDPIVARRLLRQETAKSFRASMEKVRKFLLGNDEQNGE